MTRLDRFISYLQEQCNNRSIYVWGAQGQAACAITESFIKSREKSATNAGRAIAYWKKQMAAGYGDVLRAFDCSGLGMYWLQNTMGLYKSDMSADGMMGTCTKISRDGLRRGDWVFRVNGKGKATHIGYVADDALHVIEAKGRDDGVVKRALTDNGKTYWNAYGRPAIFAGDPNGQAASACPPTVLKLTSPPMRGSAVEELQTALTHLGYPCGAIDGICGEKTIRGIAAFIKAHGYAV
ncbi:MAG: C40 family peptidase [Clostridiales bacterium]|nr:C40 family peptidase [Clostridiales bacterium]